MKAPALVAVLLAALTVGSIQALGGSAASTTPAALVPNWIGFWDKEHGLMGTGNEGELGTPDQECRHGKCHPGTISVSTDGGRTSHVLVRTHGPVTWVAVATTRQAWAVVRECKRRRCARLLWHSSDAGASWSVLGPAHFQTASFADSKHGLGVESGLIATADGGRTWHRLLSPCSGFEQGVSLVSATRGWLLCVSLYGVGNAGKSIYSTDDGGRHWQRLAHTRLVTSGGRQYATSLGGIGFYGYPLGIAFASDGVGVLWESRGTLYLTRDGGRHWKSFPKVSEPEADFGLSAVVVPGRAFALFARTPVRPVPFHLVATTSDSTRWQTVRIWTSLIR